MPLPIKRPLLRCRCCGVLQELIKAHVIPQAFFLPYREGAIAPLIASGAEGSRAIRCPIGVYDREILCLGCESQLGPADDYGIQALRKQFDQRFVPIVKAGRTICFEAEGVSNHLLLKFLVAVLWRASVSTKSFYRAISLGPHEAAAKQITFDPPPTQFGVFDAVLSKWRGVGSAPLRQIPLMDPHRERWHGVNAYRMYLGDVVAYIKVDARPFPAALCGVSLLNTPLVRVIARDFDTSPDFRAMLRTIGAQIDAEATSKTKRSHEDM